MWSKHVARASCAEIMHPWTQSCWLAYRTMCLSSVGGTCKLFLPIVLVDFALKALKKKQINEQIVRELFEDFFRSMIVGISTSTFLLVNSCTLRYLLGKFTYPSTTFIPGFLSGLPFVLLSPKLRVQISPAFGNAALETVVLLMSHSGLLPLNAITETVFFMFTNACLMYASKVSRRSHHWNYTWFFKPDQDDPEENEKIFWEKLLTRTRNYFGFGLGFGILRTLVGDFTVLKPTNIHKLFKMSTLKAGIFASSYVAIYELTVHVLNRYFQKPRSVYALPAGFLAGISYAVDPNLPINLSVFINLIQILYNLIDIRILKRIPMDTLCFCLSAGTLFHIQLLHPKSISKVGAKFIRLCSGKRSDFMMEAMKKFDFSVL